MTNRLIVIENGKLSIYTLDDRLSWELGRPTGSNHPDIELLSSTVSRRHGKFQNTDGYWFYVDYNGKNGTLYNGKQITTGRSRQLKPVMLSDGDVFLFGGAEGAAMNCKTIWAMFTNRSYEEEWKVVDTQGCESITLTDGTDRICVDHLYKVMVIEEKDGFGIYMGDLTYLIGDIRIVEGKELE